MKIELAKTEIIHFIGIGGIGMSGLALIMKKMGFNIKGSDVLANKNIERLKKDKIKITISHTKKNIAKATIVVMIFEEKLFLHNMLYTIKAFQFFQG